MKNKILIAVGIVSAMVIGLIIGFHTPHNIKYTMDRIEGDYTKYAIIEVYDASTNTIEMIDVEVE